MADCAGFGPALNHFDKATVYAILQTFIDRALLTALVYAAATDSEMDHKTIHGALLFEVRSPDGVGTTCEKVFERMLAGTRTDEDDSEDDPDVLQSIALNYAEAVDSVRTGKEKQYLKSMADRALSKAIAFGEEAVEEIDGDGTPEEEQHDEDDEDEEDEDETTRFLKQWNDAQHEWRMWDPPNQVGRLVQNALLNSMFQQEETNT